MKTKGTNIPSGTRRSFGRQFKILVAESNLTANVSLGNLAKQHNIQPGQVRHWTQQYTKGLLTESNAVCFATKPRAVNGKKDALVNLRKPK